MVLLFYGMVSLFFWRKIAFNKLGKRHFIISCISIILILLSGYGSIVYGNAPTTQKILFSSTRDGNWEIYMMNPDGSNQVNLTQHPSNDYEAV